jgi:hypothetical protein
VGLAGLAVPLGEPPPASAHVPGLLTVGGLARITDSNSSNPTHALGAESVLVVTMHVGMTDTSIAGEGAVHWAPVGPVHEHAEHTR